MPQCSEFPNELLEILSLVAFDMYLSNSYALTDYKQLGTVRISRVNKLSEGHRC